MARSLIMAHNNPTAGPWACLVLHAGRLNPFAQYTPVLLSHDAHVATAVISVGMFLGVHVHNFHCFALVHVAQATQSLPGADSSSYRPPRSRTRLDRLYLNVVQSNRRDKPHSLHCQPPSSFCRPDPHWRCLPQSRLWASLSLSRSRRSTSSDVARRRRVAALPKSQRVVEVPQDRTIQALRSLLAAGGPRGDKQFTLR